VWRVPACPPEIAALFCPRHFPSLFAGRGPTLQPARFYAQNFGSLTERVNGYRHSPGRHATPPLKTSVGGPVPSISSSFFLVRCSGMYHLDLIPSPDRNVSRSKECLLSLRLYLAVLTLKCQPATGRVMRPGGR